MTTTAEHAYSFDNDDAEATDRHQHLASMLDDFTRTRISTVGDLTGLRCLDVGAGGGSVARWLAERVGATGAVLATDLNPRHLPTDATYTVLRHDLVTEPVPAGPWDLIHARLVLLHIPERHEILGRLADALAPGGALVIEEWETSFDKIVLDAPDPATTELIERYQRTLTAILNERGNDGSWASAVHSAMRVAGLVDIDTAIQAASWPGGTAGTLLVNANVAQVRGKFHAAGFTDDELEHLRRAMNDPRVVLRGHLTYSTIGRRPAR